jgi:hypothetical protein
MNVRHKRLAIALALASACAALTPTAFGAGLGRAPQAESQRRPQGPVAGPVIKLPPGAGASDERTTTTTDAKDEGERGASAPQKWEYCSINGFSYHQKGFSLSSPSYVPAAVIRYFPSGAEEVEGVSEDQAVGAAFAKLGDDGWELAGVRTDFSSSEGNGKSSTIYLFKRPKRHE